MISPQRDAVSSSATWEWDLRTGEVQYGAGALELVGVALLEPTRSAWLAHVARKDLASLEETVRAALARGERWSVRYGIQRAGGALIEVEERGFVVRHEGRAVRALGVLRSDELMQPAPAPMNEAQFRMFVDWVPQLAWTAGPDGWLDWYNRRWFEYTGTTLEQMEGWGWVSVHDPADLPRMLRIWRNAIMTGQPWEDEFRLRRGSDGMLRWHLSRATPFRDASGRILRWFGTNTDIHDQKLAAEEYSRLLAREQQARREAEEANRAKDEFLAIVSHELRTPLNAILGWAQLLQTGALDEAKQHKAIEKIASNARLQGKLIEDLLDVSRIITGKLSMDLDALELAAVVRAAVETQRPSAEAKGVVLDMQDDAGGARVRGNAGRLQQIVGNLLANAIKFTPAGKSVMVTVRRAQQNVEIVVRDEGEGIPAAFLPRLFQRFRQADSSSTRRHGGLGLGLSIVRELVEKHEGEVSAASEGVGRGATFTVRLPELCETGPSARRQAEAGEAKSSVPLTGIKVLAVDDDLGAREVLSEILLSLGATVTLASSVHEALRAFKLDRPDVVLGDIAMPELDGYALVERIRALPDPAARRTPIIAFTAYASQEDRDRALRAGFDRYLSKPVDPARLSRLIAAAVQERVMSGA
jgi:hypothetical protein